MHGISDTTAGLGAADTSDPTDHPEWAGLSDREISAACLKTALGILDQSAKQEVQQARVWLHEALRRIETPR